ncbi:hypothetical protein HPP92_008432 [Vanilla planifolia]|uniref:Uncharacterized protein n=1 Tax=Vanilla planifolia TaxID=51239 RepID=A0A835V5N8_VANPL|nr:hypothetical protein HPP92_008432 [Vanilla planifolia]
MTNVLKIIVLKLLPIRNRKEKKIVYNCTSKNYYNNFNLNSINLPIRNRKEKKIVYNCTSKNYYNNFNLNSMYF